MQPLLRRPRASNHLCGRAALTRAESGADEGMMAIVPGRLDEHAAQMGIPGFGDPTLRAFRAARMFGRDQADKGHGARCRGEATRIPELRGDGERGAIIDAAETAQPLDARPQRLESEQGLKVRFDVTESGEHFIDRAQGGPMCWIQTGQRPRVGAQPRVMPLRPRLLGGGEPAAMPEKEFRETMPRPEQVGADVFAAPRKLAARLFLLGWDVNSRQRPGAIEHGKLARIAPVRLDPIAGSARDQGW